jgi:hypothetical protein
MTQGRAGPLPVQSAGVVAAGREVGVGIGVEGGTEVVPGVTRGAPGGSIWGCGWEALVGGGISADG